MNRGEKIGKLTRAVREWRGVTDAKTGRWIQAARPSARRRVARWLEELGIDADAGLATLAAFRSYGQFGEWVRDMNRGTQKGVER